MATKKEIGYLIGGIGVGVFGSHVVPKTKIVLTVKYLKGIVEAKKRLRKILIEEYYLIDDAIKTEESFLNMMNPRHKVTFEVRDNGEHRQLYHHIVLNGGHK